MLNDTIRNIIDVLKGEGTELEKKGVNVALTNPNEISTHVIELIKAGPLGPLMRDNPTPMIIAARELQRELFEKPEAGTPHQRIVALGVLMNFGCC